uniref:Linker l3b n=1 Tax=Glossoscolex paulistus TaxID=1046353 RepID=A0A0P4VMV3_9ANNE
MRISTRILDAGTLAVLTLVLSFQRVDAAEDPNDVQLRQTSDRIDVLLSQAVGLERKIERRIRWKETNKAGSLEARVDALAEPTCKEPDFQCGHDDPQCISNLFVCDGRKDCRNGGDERHCEVPLKPGDTFVGEKVFDNCGKLNPDHITVIIKSVKQFDFLPGFPKIEATLTIHVDQEEGETELAIPMKGFYSKGLHQMVFQASGKDGLALIGKFDGHDFDHFVGESVSEFSRHVCAHFIYTRQQEG